jgi:hypothetical protein
MRGGTRRNASTLRQPDHDRDEYARRGDSRTNCREPALQPTVNLRPRADRIRLQFVSLVLVANICGLLLMAL